MRRVCVVGSGPGGLYASKYLLKALGAGVRVDVVDRLPVPYGLVRYGVAPDHPEVKAVTNDFDDVMRDPRVRFFGNVDVGSGSSSASDSSKSMSTSTTVSALLGAYDGVILAYGASSDRELGLPEEARTSNVWGARDFVNWYNGHPDMAERAPPLLDCETAVVVGQGNVALDCARLLTKSVDELAGTDISSSALAALAASRVRRVAVVGRRGSVQAAFTIKELRELTKLAGVGCVIDPAEVSAGLTEASLEEAGASRGSKRIDALVQKIAASYDESRQQPRRVDLRFLLSPTELLRSSDPARDPDRVAGVTLSRNALTGAAFHQRAVALEPAEFETIECGLLIRSIGYRSEPLAGVPWASASSTVQHTAGRVDGVAGLYASGWVKRGPTGIVGTNIADAKETVDSLVADMLEGGRLPPPKRPGEDHDVDFAADVLGLQGAAAADTTNVVVSWDDYERIDRLERATGAAQSPPRPREKLLTVQAMCESARQGEGAKLG